MPRKQALRAFMLAGMLILCSQNSRSYPISEDINQPKSQDLLINRNSGIYNAYILGPGDTLNIELLDLPEFSGNFEIGPDGTLYLPRLRALFVEGLTVEELRNYLTEQYSAYVISPEVYVRLKRYRPIRIYVSGEVRRPGYYSLSGVEGVGGDVSVAGSKAVDSSSAGLQSRKGSVTSGTGNLFPTVFDAIRSAKGITPYSDLSKVTVTRKQPLSSGGGKIRTELNFMSLIMEGEESQNIRLFDGDVVNVSKSDSILKEQLLKAGESNLSPQFLTVYLSGRVKSGGGKTLPQGSSLNQAIDLAGGLRVLHGRVEFVRFNREGTIDRRVFRYNSKAPADSYSNPVLMAGDIIRIQDSPASAAIGILNEITMPAVGVYSIYSLTGGFSQ